MPVFQPVNFVNTTVASSVSSTSTTITLTSTSGLPSSITSPIIFVLNDAATRSVYEVVYATAISGSNITVTRAQEGTAAQTWAVGDYIFVTNTAGLLGSKANTNGSSSQPFSASQLTAGGLNSTSDLVLQAGGTGGVFLESPTHTSSVNAGNTGFVQHYVAAATIGAAAVNLAQAQADFAAINGSSSETFSASQLTANGLTATSSLILQAGGAGGVFLASPTNTSSVTPGISGYVEHYVANATNVLAAVNLGQFPSSLSANGWKKYPDPNSPSGYFIEQWGTFEFNNGSTSNTITFPVAFPNGALSVNTTDNGSQCFSYGNGQVSNSQFTHYSTTTAVHGGYWVAKGY